MLILEFVANLAYFDQMTAVGSFTLPRAADFLLTDWFLWGKDGLPDWLL